MQINRVIRDFIFILFAVYYSQDWLYKTGSILSQACIMIIILISFVYFLKTLFIKDKNNLFYNAWTLFIILNIFGFILNPDFSAGLSRDMFKSFLGCMLPFYPFYYFASKEQVKPTHLIRFFMIMLPVIILQYFKNQSNILLEGNTDNGYVVNNIAYSFVNFLPTVFLIKKNKILSGIFIILIVFFILQGAKRGAIVACFIGLMMYFYYQVKTIEMNRRIFGYITVIIVLIGLIIFAYHNIVTNEFLLYRLSSITEGNSSGRDLIYGSILNKWYNSDNLLNYIFGFGFASSVNIAGDYAHSDWLELLSNFGLIGIFAYMFLFYAALKYCRNSDWMEDKQILMMTITMIWFFITLISMWYSSLGGYPQAILLGYLMGSKSKSMD